MIVLRIEKALRSIPEGTWRIVDIGRDDVYVDIWQQHQEESIKALEKEGLEIHYLDLQDHPWTLGVKLSRADKQAQERSDELQNIGKQARKDVQSGLEISDFKFVAIKRAIGKFRNITQEDLKELEQGWNSEL